MRECVRLDMDLVEHPMYNDIIDQRPQPKEADLESDDTLDAPDDRQHHPRLRRLQVGAGIGQ